MNSQMTFASNGVTLIPKMTQFQLRLESTNEVIAEADLDLAAFANSKTYSHRLPMTETAPLA